MTEPPQPGFHALSREAWRQWLQQHHGSAAGVWLITFKKATGKPRLDYDAAVEEALCFGWIDSKPRKVDAERTALWFAPRKPGSGWSRPNKARVQQLASAGLMTQAGLDKVEQARRDGSWTRLDEVEALRLPDDLVRALASLPAATAHFEAFPRSAKRGILEWIASARTQETRRKRVDETARLVSLDERANQWRRKA